MAEIVAVIPARFGSTRLPGKPLLSDTGRPLIQHVVEAASRSTRIGRVIVATDDDRIADAVRRFGGEVAMTRADHPSGTDRVAEVAAALTDARVIVNVQGDEPEIGAEALDRLVALMDDGRWPMATLCTPFRGPEDFPSPSCVKVVFAADGRALYFSRSPIPHHRDGPVGPSPGHLHLGLYAYDRAFLVETLAALAPSPLEKAEKLEQLRVLEAGYPIGVAVVDEPSVGIDTPEDYRRFVERWRSRPDA